MSEHEMTLKRAISLISMPIEWFNSKSKMRLLKSAEYFITRNADMQILFSGDITERDIFDVNDKGKELIEEEIESNRRYPNGYTYKEMLYYINVLRRKSTRLEFKEKLKSELELLKCKANSDKRIREINEILDVISAAEKIEQDLFLQASKGLGDKQAIYYNSFNNVCRELKIPICYTNQISGKEMEIRQEKIDRIREFFKKVQGETELKGIMRHTWERYYGKEFDYSYLKDIRNYKSPSKKKLETPNLDEEEER